MKGGGCPAKVIGRILPASVEDRGIRREDSELKNCSSRANDGSCALRLTRSAMARCGRHNYDGGGGPQPPRPMGTSL